ncbi:hypothetical protein X798_02376 [Onchocerca flexuosa]|uniref:Transmembrane protein n=1 Tax=Onchocerca flexuosa TaxID=387005 RepID=A0A238BZD3_9BILA|nr:hypothetical protein X798_02376 [Onchocerca flexuosa]
METVTRLRRVAYGFDCVVGYAGCRCSEVLGYCVAVAWSQVIRGLGMTKDSSLLAVLVWMGSGIYIFSVVILHFTLLEGLILFIAFGLFCLKVSGCLWRILLFVVSRYVFLKVVVLS